MTRVVRTRAVALLRQWIDLRSLRERMLLAVAFGFALVWLAYAVVWQPIWIWRKTLGNQISQYDQALTLLASGSVAPDRPAVPDDQPAAMAITSTAVAARLNIRRLQPEGNTVQVVLDEAPFEAVLLWIEVLERDHALRLVSLELTRRPAPGVVSAALTVER